MIKYYLLISSFSAFCFFTYGIGNELNINYSFQNTSNQNESVEHVKISFLESFNYSMNDETSWVILTEQTAERIATGKGAIVDYKFQKPGKYVVQITEQVIHTKSGCNHAHYPAKLLVDVSENHMVFDFSTIQFSTEINGDVSTNGTILTVDVDFQQYNTEAIFFKNKMQSAGIETSIAGEMIEDQKLSPGKNKLVYQLTGIAQKDTYIMLDFVDINGQTQSYSLLRKL